MKIKEILNQLEGKTALITGGSGKLGPIWIETCQELGINTFIIDKPDYDVSDIHSVESGIDACRDKHGIPEILINNAAIDNPPSGGGMSFWNYKRIIEVNLIGSLNTCCMLMDKWTAKDINGIVVNIGSIMGNIGADWRNYPQGFSKPIGYNMSKAALIHLSKCLACQYGKRNIRAVTTSFGPVDKGLPEEFKEKFIRNVPLGRFISEQSLKMTLVHALLTPEYTGQQTLVDAGYTSW